MAASVVLQGVSVRFGDVEALRHVSLSVKAGERVALLGPSGAGKTTLLRLLNASALPTGGSVSVDGRDLASLDDAALRRLRARTGVIHQDLRLVPNLRVSRNVLSGGLGRQGFLASLKTMLRASDAELESVHALLERVGVGEKLFQRTDRLSGGQQQRVAIARALYQEPALLLADEPVASVDPARARDVVGLLAQLADEDGVTLMTSLHDAGLARRFFPRVIGLREGSVVFDRPSADVTDADLASLYALPDESPNHDGA